MDLLLLDEPTNHIDERTIEWLEAELKRYPGALMMVTHDRYFLDRVCGRIVEIDGGGLYVHEGNFSYYLEQKAAREEMEVASARKRRSILRTELEWLKRGARAVRPSRRRAFRRYEELSKVEGPKRGGAAPNGFSQRAGWACKVVEIEDVSKGFDGVKLIEHFSYVLLRDDRVGIVGPNGCGKTTLLSMIAGMQQPGQRPHRRRRYGSLRRLCAGIPAGRSDLRVIDYMRSIAEYVQTPDGKLSASQMLESFLFPRSSSIPRCAGSPAASGGGCIFAAC